jgi:hypothetical protein
MKEDKQKSEQPEADDWKKIPDTVGFRLDDEHKLVLFERARLLKMSIHELARRFVIERLHEADERQQLIGAMLGLRDEVAEARKDIAISTQELLVSAGRAKFSDAQGWVAENLIKE